ncbi:hypothetical protein QNH90_26100, partial [Klebsiella pneumoniae]|nr:hypothetical protein [Klebsiella pneumoniae]
MKISSVLAVIISAFLLTACSSEPSQDDIFKAMRKWTGSYLTSVKKVDCTKEYLSLTHISEPTRRTPNSTATTCLKKKNNIQYTI